MMPDQAVDSDKSVDAFVNQDEILLGVLTAIERNANTSQRLISHEIGVALGLANAYLKRCARKGLIKIQQIPRRRYAYYLTPQGFAEKARLTGEYLSASLTFFRRARTQISEIVSECAGRGWKSIAVAGISDLAEIAILCAQDHGLTYVAVIDSARAGERFHGLPVVSGPAQCGNVDCVIVTALDKPEKIFLAIEKELGPGRVIAPALLRLNRNGSGESRSFEQAGK
jgi:hypothetical protein